MLIEVEYSQISGASLGSVSGNRWTLGKTGVKEKMGRIDEFPRLADQSKLPHVGTTIFTQMSALATQEQALNLSQGFPDFDAPKPLLDGVQQYLNSGFNQYAPMQGVASLREAVAAKVKNLYGADLNVDTEITITSGATEALFCAISAVVRPGDEVILFDPAYDSYEPVVELCGGTAVHIPLQAPDFSVDWDRVADALSDKTRLIITNTPHNPTGALWSEQDIAALGSLISDKPVYLVADEVYEHICFDGVPHQSLCRYPDLFERSFVVSSFGKTYHVTGWKIGYCLAPQSLTAEFRKIHQFNTFTSNTPIQYALADFMRSHPEHHEELADFYQAKRDYLCDLLAKTRFAVSPAQGTYFQLIDYSAVSEETDVDLAMRFTKELKLASIPVSVFYEEPGPHSRRYLRLCFAKDNDTLAAAASILRRL